MVDPDSLPLFTFISGDVYQKWEFLWDFINQEGTEIML